MSCLADVAVVYVVEGDREEGDSGLPEKISLPAWKPLRSTNVRTAPIISITEVAIVVRSAKAPISSLVASMAPYRVGSAGNHQREVNANTTTTPQPR